MTTPGATPMEEREIGAIDWESRDDLLRIRREAARLWDEDYGTDTGWSAENRDCFMIRATLALATRPAQHEAVREAVLEEAAKIADRVKADYNQSSVEWVDVDQPHTVSEAWEYGAEAAEEIAQVLRSRISAGQDGGGDA